MQARNEDGANARWLNKPVAESRLLDSMESLSRLSTSRPWRTRMPAGVAVIVPDGSLGQRREHTGVRKLR
jgi:hypothetical protein